HSQSRQSGQSFDLGETAEAEILEFDGNGQDGANDQRGEEGYGNEQLLLRIERTARWNGRRDYLCISALEGAVLHFRFLIARQQRFIELFPSLQIGLESVQRDLGVVLLLDLLFQPFDLGLQVCLAGMRQLRFVPKLR